MNLSRRGFLASLVAVAVGAKAIVRGELAVENPRPLPNFDAWPGAKRLSPVIDDSITHKPEMSRFYVVNREYLDLVPGTPHVIQWRPVKEMHFRADEIEERDTLWSIPPERKQLA